MRPGASDHPRRVAIDRRLLVSLYAAEFSACVLFLCQLRYTGIPAQQFFRSLAGAGCLFFVLTVVASLATAIRRYFGDRTENAKSFWMTVTLNIFTLAMVVLVSESTLRVLTRATREGLLFAGTRLLPRDWESVSSSNRAILERASPGGKWEASFLVRHETLGWVNGPNRTGSDGLSFSSSEGLRSSSPEVSFREEPAKRTIAILGDSYTFSLDVGYEESWGHLLERKLGPDYRVLNFGVDGYGLDQAYLRYREQGRDWRPEIVILGFVQHDLRRSMAVYAFVSFPSWYIPFAKPRMLLSSGHLRSINLPLPDPEEIFSMPDVHSLPFIEYDPSYHPAEWQRSWYHSSHLLRYFVSKTRKWPAASEFTSDEAMISLNQAILTAFVDLAAQDGARPLVVYFPTRGAGELSIADGIVDRVGPGIARELIDGSDVDVFDLTSCVSAVPANQRLVPGKTHYAAASNRAVSDCLFEVVRPAVRHMGTSGGKEEI